MLEGLTLEMIVATAIDRTEEGLVAAAAAAGATGATAARRRPTTAGRSHRGMRARGTRAVVEEDRGGTTGTGRTGTTTGPSLSRGTSGSSWSSLAPATDRRESTLIGTKIFRLRRPEPTSLRASTVSRMST